MNLNQLKISGKLGLATGVVVLLMAALGLIALRQMAVINGHMEALGSDHLPSIDTAAQIQNAVNELRRVELQMALAAVPEDKEAETARVAGVRRRIGDQLLKYEPLAGADERATFEAAKRDIAAYLATNDRVTDMLKPPGPANEGTVRYIFGESRKATRAARADLDKLIDITEHSSADALAQARAAYATARTTIIGLVLGAVFIAALFSFWIGRLISQPIQRAVGVTKRFAGGDLTQRIEATGRDEPSQLLRALADMQTQFASTVMQVRDNAESVSVASAEIATGNLDLSQRTEQQAASLQESAASMEQLGSTVRLNSDSAQQANKLAQDASAVANEGSRVVAEAAGTMKGIEDSSRRIAEIISTIDSIAFQTNILALNAAVEAARAGEQGRGFAVVASEVRSLAQRSATAAKEIKALIDDSVARVGDGARQVDRARTTMQAVAASIDRVCGVINEISAAGAEQSAGIQQVGAAVQKMDQTTQQNAALVEESAAAAESLKQQARRLVEAVAVFHIEARHPVAASV